MKFLLDFPAEDAMYGVLRSLDDYLVEVERQDGTLVSGYVTANDDGLRLRSTFQPSPKHGPTDIMWDDIKRIEVQ
jgi:hypothetical protein